jgi:hypothetical protein
VLWFSGKGLVSVSGRAAVTTPVRTNRQACQRGQRCCPVAPHDGGPVVFHLALTDPRVCRDVLAGATCRPKGQNLVLARRQVKGRGKADVICARLSGVPRQRVAVVQQGSGSGPDHACRQTLPGKEHGDNASGAGHPVENSLQGMYPALKARTARHLWPKSRKTGHRCCMTQCGFRVKPWTGG